MAFTFMVYHSVNSPDVRPRKQERARLARKLQHGKRVVGFDNPYEKA